MHSLTLGLLVSSAATFAHSLDPFEAEQNVGSDLDPGILIRILEKYNFEEKKSADDKKYKAQHTKS